MNEFIPRIIVDERERGPIRILLQDMGFEVATRTLDVADFVVSERMAVERKRGDDFAASLFDGRLFEQIPNLLESYEYPIIVIEEFNLMFQRYEEKMAELYGALAKLGLLGIQIIPTHDYTGTALLLKSLCKKEQLENGQIVIERSNKKKFTLREKQLFLIEGLMNVGHKKANELLDKFINPENVFNAILESSVLYTKTGNVKGIRGPMKVIEGFGPSFVKENKELLVGVFIDEKENDE